MQNPNNQAYYLQQQAMMQQQSQAANFFANQQLMAQQQQMQQTQLLQQQTMSQQLPLQYQGTIGQTMAGMLGQQSFQYQATIGGGTPMGHQQFQNSQYMQQHTNNRPVIDPNLLSQSMTGGLQNFQRSTIDQNTQFLRSQSPLGQTFDFGGNSSAQSNKMQMTNYVQYQQPFDLGPYDMYGRPSPSPSGFAFFDPMMQSMQVGTLQRLAQHDPRFEKQSLQLTQTYKYEQVLQKLVDKLREFPQPKDFFKQFDTFQSRKFYTWELTVMFGLSYPEARTITNCSKDEKFGDRVKFEKLCNELQKVSVNINFGDFKMQSDYVAQFNQLLPKQREHFKQIANFLRQNKELAPNSGTYHEVFVTLHKQSSDNNHKHRFSIQKTFLRETLRQKRGDSNYDEFIDFIMGDYRESVMMSVIQFNQAMRQIVPDYKQWDLSELLQYMTETQPPINKMRQDFYDKGILEDFRRLLEASTNMIECKKVGGGGEVIKCVKSDKLIPFLDNRLNYSREDKEKYLKAYKVEPIIQNSRTMGRSQGQQSLQNILKKGEQSKADSINDPGASQSLDQSFAPSQSLQVPRVESPSAQLQRSLHHDPSGESLNQRVESQPNNPATLTHNDAIPEEVPERSEHDDFDDDYSHEFDQKEGEADLKEGGQREPNSKPVKGTLDYYDFTRLLNDLQPTDETRERTLTFVNLLRDDVFESIKGWLILSNDTVLALFKQIDRRGTFLATRRMLQIFLSRVLSPRECTDEMINSITNFFKQINENGMIVVDYCVLYKFFYAYANLKRDRMRDEKIYFEQFNFLTGSQSEAQQSQQRGEEKLEKPRQSLGALMEIKQVKTLLKHEEIEVAETTFFYKLKTLMGKQANFTDKLKTLLQSSAKNISLRKFQEFVGVEKEPEPHFVEQSYRQFCKELFLIGIDCKSIKESFKKIEHENQFPLIHETFSSLAHKNKIVQQHWENVRGGHISFNMRSFKNRVEAEMNKMFQLMRLYVQLKQKMKSERLREVKDIFDRYGTEGLGEISRKDFERFLSDLYVCSSEDYIEIQYFLEEYDSDDTGKIALKKIEEDFDDFVGNEDSLLEKIASYLLKKAAANCDLFQEICDLRMTAQEKETHRNSIVQKNQLEAGYPQYKRPRDTIHVYDFQEMFSWIFAVKFSGNGIQQGTAFDGNLLALVSQHIANEGPHGSSILSTQLVLKRVYNDASTAERNQPQLERIKRFLRRQDALQIEKRIVQTMHYLDKGPLDYFRGEQVRDSEFEDMLSNVELHLKSLLLTFPLIEIAEYWKSRNSALIDLRDFQDNLTRQLKALQNSQAQLNSINRQLISKGVRIEEAIRMCQGNLHSASASNLSFDDLISLCLGYDIKFEPVAGTESYGWLSKVSTGLGKQHLVQISSIMQTFERDERGEIPLKSFVEALQVAIKPTKEKPEFMRWQQTEHLSAGDQALPEITAQRNFHAHDTLIESIALEIQRRKLTDFGSYLKGHDYFGQDQITHADFFQILETIFSQHLAKGDVLDVIQYFDKEGTGWINLSTVATDLNRRMKSCFIVLQSSLALVNEPIVEQITPRLKTQKKSRPEEINLVFLDLLCGLHNHGRGSSIEEWLSMFGRQEEGCIAFGEFRIALDKMDVQVPQQSVLKVFEYLKSQQSDEFSNNLVKISELLSEVAKEIPQEDLDSVAYSVLKRAAPVIAENQTPLRESCQKYETFEGSGQMLYSDFTYQLLTDQLKLKHVLTPNMIETLHKHFNRQLAQHVSYEPFISELKVAEKELKIKIFMTKKEVDDANFGQTGQQTTRGLTAAPKVEPIYEVTTTMNTYTRVVNSVNIKPLTDRDHIENCNDILLGTKAKGMSVEQYFQQYGLVNKRDGIRYLTSKDFRSALLGLRLKWAENPDIVKRLFTQIEDNYSMFDGVTLEMLGGTIFLNSTVNLVKVEADVLKQIHRFVCEADLIYTVPDLFNFINFERDGTIPLRDFARLLLDTFKLRGRINQTTIEAFYQRYRVVGSPVNAQEVCAYDFLQDLAYQHVNVGAEVQFGAKIVEKILKQLQLTTLRETNTNGIQDTDVLNELRQFFMKSSNQGGTVNFTYSDMVRLMKSLGYESDSDGRPNKTTENFFKLCSVLGASHPSTTRSFNQEITGRREESKSTFIDLPALPLPETIKFDELVQAVSKLIQKPIAGLYQDVLDQVYMSSKQRQVSISGPYLLTLFKGEDIGKNGLVSAEVFDRVISKRLCHDSRAVSDDDIAFLASKYFKSHQLGQLIKQVCYKDFLNDYYEHETGRLGDCMNLIFAEGNQRRQQDILKSMGKNSPRALANSVNDLPAEQRTIFLKMGKYLRSKDLDELLCGELIMRDLPKRGYLEKSQIKEAVTRIGIPISERQATELIQVLKQDSSAECNYLEMIAYLMDPQYMQRLQQENNIWPDRSYTEMDIMVDITKLKLSANLIAQLELKLASIRQNAHLVHRGTQMVKTDQIFEIFSQSQVILNPKDTDTLQRYLTQVKDADNYVSINDLLQHFKVDEEPSSVLQNIQRQLGEKQQVFGQAKTFEFGDFKACLLKAGVTLPANNSSLQKLFNLLCDHQNEVSRHTLDHLFLQERIKSVRKVVELPQSGKKFVDFLIRSKIDILAKFNDCKKTKRIPSPRFTQFLHEVKFNFETPADKKLFNEYFQTSDGQIDFVKLFKCLQQADPHYGKSKGAGLTAEERSRHAVKTFLFMPHKIKVILSKLAQLAKNKRLSNEQLFRDLDSNKDGRVPFTELDEFCLLNEISIGIPRESIKALFDYLDYDNDGSISLHELSSMLVAAQLNQEERMKKAFSPAFDRQLRGEVSELFDRLDADKNKYLTADELVLAQKQLHAMFSLDLEGAREIVAKIGSDDKVSKKQFVEFVVSKQKEQLLSIDDSLEDMRSLFEHYCDRGQAEFDGKRMMKLDGLKRLIVSTGHTEVTDEEVAALFADIDTNQGGEIDVDEFMAYMYAGDKIDAKSRNTILAIRKAHMRLNTKGVIDMLRLAPAFTTCSITQKFLEKEQVCRPSSNLIPQYCQKSLSYKDLAKVADYVKALQNRTEREFITGNKPTWGFECSVSEIVGVPAIPQLLGEDATTGHKEIRVFLMHQRRKVVQSGIQICRATTVKSKDEKSANWSLPKAQNSFCLRSDENLDLVFELVSFDTKDKSKQLTIAWASSPLSKLVSGKNQLQLQGGNPFNQHATQIDEQVPKSGIVSKFFGGVQKREVVLNVKSFLKFDEKQKAQLCVLPDDTVTWKNLLGFAVAFRVYSHERLVQNSDQMHKPAADLVLSQFSKIYDSPDIVEVLAESWQHLLVNDKSTAEQVKLMEKSVNRVYGLFTAAELQFDSVYPTRSTTGQLYMQRNQEIKRAVTMGNHNLADRFGVGLHDRVKDQIVFMEEYTPFTINEMHGVSAQVGIDHANERKQDELEQMFAQLGLKL